MYYPKAETQHKEDFDTDVLTDLEDVYQIIVWNDEVNTFEWVIDTLMDICGHTEDQAEQCALIIHTHGKYAVQTGTLNDLKPKCEAIIDRGIGATLEVLTR